MSSKFSNLSIKAAPTILLKYSTLMIIVFLSTYSFAQNTQLDTVFVKRSIDVNVFEIDTMFIPGGISSPQVLAGTTFLPSSDKIVGLLNKGLSPISIEILQDCDNTIDPSRYHEYPQFLDITRDTNQLSIDVTVIANCCHNFLAEAEVLGQDTLNLVYTSYGAFCSCECPFALRYRFNTTFEENYQLLKYVTINQSHTVGQIPSKE